ncbi:MAG: hypothetical protein WDN08_11560 [Rhizomicrobium sp.]
MDAAVRKTGLECWDARVTPRSVQDRVDQMRAHPRFSDSIRMAARASLAGFDDSLNVDRSVNDVGRYYLGILALYLDATGGLTHRRLRALCARIGTFSSGRATAILWQLRRIGYVTPATDHVNGSMRVYLPTAEMTRSFRNHMRSGFQALVVVEPHIAPLLSRFDDPEIFRLFLEQLGDGAIDAATNEDAQTKPVAKLWARANGLLFLQSLFMAADDGGALPSLKPFAISVAAEARRFRCSRTHIRSLLRDIERAGFIARDAADGALCFTPLGHDTIQRFYAIGHFGMSAIVHRTLAAYGQ